MADALISPRSTNSRWVKWLKLGGTVLTIGLFIYLLLKQDWQNILMHLGRIPVWVWPLCVLLAISGMVFNAIRWYILLAIQKVVIPFWNVLKITFSGSFASNFLPSTIGGDAYRIFAIRAYCEDLALPVASVFVDRLLNVCAMLTNLPLSLLTFGGVLPVASSSLVLQAGMTLNFKKIGDFVKRLIHKWGQVVKIWFKHPGYLGLAFVVAWLSIFVIFLLYWLLAHFLEMPIALYQVMGTTVITYLITLLPISINGYGLREMAIVTLYTRLGATLEQAVAFAVLSRFFLLIETLPGALWISKYIISGWVDQEKSEPRDPPSL
jgi:uncharacterized membrane protein YbhN (UPF0104 family)